MLTPQLTRRIFWAAEGFAFLAALAVGVWLARANEWHPVGLVALLFVLAFAGQRLSVRIRGHMLTALLVALVLVMSLLGPFSAMLLGVALMIISSGTRRISASDWLNNLSTFAVFPLAGGLLVRALAGDVHNAASHHLTRSVTFALIVFAVYMTTLALNFALVAVDVRVLAGRSFIGQVRDGFAPLLPGHISLAVLAAVLAVAYTNLGLEVLFCAILVLLVFQYLMSALLRSEDRADQLEARSIHLASLQLGVLRTLVETLALRDRSTARHAAAVARYARELAREAECSEEQIEVVHTAGLLHDIGKFALPDHILRAEVLSDDDWSLIRRHPQDGATLVGRLDGYGDVAEAILYHHERIDGGGYPAGLIGHEIPLASRIIAICSTYDTLTARDSYRSPMTPKDAMAELRRVAGRQLDGELVETFIAMLERHGPVTTVHGDEADFEAELAFDRRARKIAQPHG